MISIEKDIQGVSFRIVIFGMLPVTKILDILTPECGFHIVRSRTF